MYYFFVQNEFLDRFDHNIILLVWDNLKLEVENIATAFNRSDKHFYLSKKSETVYPMYLQLLVFEMVSLVLLSRGLSLRSINMQALFQRQNNFESDYQLELEFGEGCELCLTIRS